MEVLMSSVYFSFGSSTCCSTRCSTHRRSTFSLTHCTTCKSTKKKEPPIHISLVAKGNGYRSVSVAIVN